MAKKSNKKEKNDKKRDQRRKRRIRSQVIAYLVLVLIIAVLAVGGYFLMKYYTRNGGGNSAGNGADVSANEAVSAQSAEGEVSENEVGGVVETPTDVVLPEDTASENVVEEVSTWRDTADAEALAVVDAMSVEDKVDGLFLVTPEALTNVDVATVAGDGTKKALEEYAVGGVYYRAQNIKNSDKFKTMVSNTQSWYSELNEGRTVLTFVSEDGANNTIAGKKTGVKATDTPAKLGTSGDRENAKTAFATIGGVLKDYGIDGNLGLEGSYKADAKCYLGDSLFSDDADITASMVGAAIEGTESAGVISCVAAFPGEGNVTDDPLKKAITTDKPLEELRTSAFLPFLSAIDAGVDMMQISPITAPNAGAEDPAMLSSYMITELLRTEFAYEGVIVTSPLEELHMEGVDAGTAAVLSLQAGADMVMVLKNGNFTEARKAVLAAVNDGTLDADRIDQSLVRIMSLK